MKNFFEKQDSAKQNTRRLLSYFTFVVLGLFASTYFLLSLDQIFTIPETSKLVQDGNALKFKTYATEVKFWNPKHFILSILIPSSIVLLGFAYRYFQLKMGGVFVARHLNAALIDPNTSQKLSLKHQQALNVVEEMAVSSGTRVPQVYLLENEQSINAFSAGNGPEDAVIGISAGALEHLSRDQLQGIVAHEFSHILNNDMKMKTKIVGLVFGISFLYLLGKRMIHFSTNSVYDIKHFGGVLAAAGFVLCLFGSLGAFFGRLIKYAINREREYLADAAAIEFTRNPEGILVALKKTKEHGSLISNHRSQEFSHMFFSDPTTDSFIQNIFSTHPSLKERVAAISSKH